MTLAQTTPQVLRGIALACLFATLVTPLIVLQSGIFPFVTGKTLWLRLMLQASLACWLFALITGDRARIIPGRLLAVLGLLLAVHALADSAAISPARAFFGTVERQEGFLGMTYFAVHAALATTLLDHAWLRRYVAGMVVVSLLVGLSGLYTAWFWWPHHYAGGTLGNPSYLGIYCAMHVFLACWLGGRWRWAILPLVVAIAATQSRGAMLALVAGAAVLFWPRAELRARMAMGSACVTMAVIGLIMLPDNERWPVWTLALEAFDYRPWLGYGHEHFEAIWNAFGGQLPVNTRAYDRAHNWVLDRLMDAGLFGLAAWSWLVWEIGRRAPAAVRAALTSYLIGGFFLFDVLATTATLAAVAAIAFSSEARDVDHEAVVVAYGQPALHRGARAGRADRA